MPLSRARDRERKRLARLESGNVQPKVVIPGLEIRGNKVIGVQSNLYSKWKDAHLELDRYGHPRDIDADGNVMPEFT